MNKTLLILCVIVLVVYAQGFENLSCEDLQATRYLLQEEILEGLTGV